MLKQGIIEYDSDNKLRMKDDLFIQRTFNEHFAQTTKWQHEASSKINFITYSTFDNTNSLQNSLFINFDDEDSSFFVTQSSKLITNKQKNVIQTSKQVEQEQIKGKTNVKSTNKDVSKSML